MGELQKAEAKTMVAKLQDATAGGLCPPHRQPLNPQTPKPPTTTHRICISGKEREKSPIDFEKLKITQAAIGNGSANYG